MDFFETRKEMIKFFSNKIEKPIILEIGIFKGDFFDYIYNNCSPEKLIGVDIFEGHCVSGNEDGNNVISTNLSNEYTILTNKYKNNSNVQLIKNFSYKYLSTIPDNTCDIIYIDGDHSYEGVKKDLAISFLKIKNNGYIMGHDYEMNMKKAKTYYNFGVKQAVDEFCQNNNQTIIAKGLDGCVSFCIQIKK
jgi:hypothetical protein